MESMETTLPTESSESISWKYRLGGLAPDSRTTLFVLHEGCLANSEDLQRCRREFSTEGLAEKRVRELCLGRTALRRALIEQYGVDPGWVPIGDVGMPALPRGIRASITHSTIDGVPMAAVV